MFDPSSFRVGQAVRRGLLVLACAAAVTVSHAQSNRGTVTGVVQDATGAVVANAEVVLKSPSQGTTIVLKTNSAGVYRFDSVNTGDYVVTVKSAGFVSQEQPATVVVGSTVGRDFKLAVGSSNDTVEVVSNSLELQTEDAVRGGTVASRELAELPISGQNSLNLILTAPGVVRSNLAAGGSLDSGIGAVNGARARSNNFLIDGLQNNDISVAGPQYVITNNDVLQEVNFQTSNFSPEFGRAGGAIVSQITKSGTNKIHGTVAVVYRSQLFRATTSLERSAFTSNLATYAAQQAAGNTSYPYPDVKNKFHEFRPAITIGGPLVIPHLYDGKDRTFIFGGGQLFRDRYNALATFTSIPTATGYTTLNNLAASTGCSNVRLYLSILNALGNPTSSFQQAATSIAVPTSLATSTCNGTARTGQTLSTGQFYRSAREAYDDQNFNVRLDHKVSEKQSMLFRFLYDDNVDNLGGSEAVGPAFDVPSRGRTMGGAFNDVYQVKNNLLNEFRFGYTRSSVKFLIPASAALGASLPAYSATSLNIPAISSSFSQGRTANSFEYEDTLTYVKGKHAFKVGGAFLRQLAVQIAPFNSRGTVAYSQITAANSAAYYATAVTAIANFIDDYAGVSSAPVNKLFDTASPAQPGTYRPNLFTQSYFAQDTWKVTPDLTLVYGLRYENFGQPANSLPNPAFVGYGTSDYLSTARVNQDNNNVGPTFGFSYNPHIGGGLLNGRTVIRGGYQVTYDTFYNNLLSNMKAASPNSPSNLTTASAISATTLRGTPGISTALATAVPTLNPYTTQSSIFPKNIRNPYYHHFSLGIQEQLPAKMVLDVAYVGTLGRQLFFTNPINPGLPNTAQTAVATQTTTYGTQTLRVYANRGNVQTRDSGLTSNYHSLQIQLRHKGLSTPVGHIFFQTSYTWSKNLDVLTETFATSSSGQNPSRSPLLGGPLGYLDYGPSDNDRRNVSSTVVNWAVRGPSRGVLKRVLGGWSVAPILTAQSGTPYTVLNGVDRDLDGSTLGDRPDVGNMKAAYDSRGTYDTTCTNGVRNLATSSCTSKDQVRYILVTTYSPSSPSIAHRNFAYTTRYLNLDTNILKKIAIKNDVNLELRGEFFNVTNNQNYDTPSAYSNLNTYGASTNFLNTSLQSGGSRSFRVGGKLLF
ncbi:MAG: carboxypeptidase-like regulatory domain-containing protein [Acidobacteriaceae bacterium]|nr:carboxypeptidase-like regulatory domain-containing protein [Acidobacteriaceae bacterium]